MERILVKVLDGRWEVLGVDRDPGAKPSAAAPSWNPWGPDALSFALQRDPSVQHPDLQAFTPVRWEVDGRVLWSGFTIDSPGAGGDWPTIGVQALGWQHHLDDDVYSQLYVHSDPSEWKDTRSYPAVQANTQLTRFHVNATVTEGPNPILSWPKNGAIDPDDIVGITFDCGPDEKAWPSQFDLAWEAIGGGLTANFLLYVRLSDSIETIVSTGVTGTDRHDAVSALTSNTAQGGTLIPSGAPRRRYITVMIVRNPGAAAVASNGADIGIRITKLNLYRDASYRLGGGPNTSRLTVSQLVADALQYAPLFDQALDAIAATSLVLQHADWRLEERTPRETIEQYNAYHRYRVRVDHKPKLSYQPQPARATLKVHAGRRGARFVDASANSGRDVYNKVIVRGRTGSGDPIKITRLAANLPGAARVRAAAALQPSNPSADVDASGWSSLPGAGGAVTITRDTGVYSSAPASIKAVQGAAFVPAGGVRAAFSAGGTFRAGLTYALGLLVRLDYPGAVPALTMKFGVSGGDEATAFAVVGAAGAFALQAVAWTPLADVASNLVTFSAIRPSGVINPNAATAIYLDDLEVTIGAVSLADRRGFLRTKVLDVQSPTDPVACEALGDAFLTLASKAQLKGTLEISSDTAVVELLTERPVPVTDIGSKSGELILLSNLIDPDYATLGRVGTMADVSYADGKASVTIDNQRDNFEAVLARMGVTQKNA